MRPRTPTSALSLFILCATLACSDDAEQAAVGVQQDDIKRLCRTDIDIAPLQLAKNFCVVATMAAPAASAMAFDSKQLLTFSLAEAKADNSRQLLVESRELELETGAVGDPVPYLETPAPRTDDTPIYAGQYLALARDGSVAVGYTLGDETRSGAIQYGQPQQQVERMDAKGNYDAIWLDEDTLLVNGLGLGDTETGAAVYAYSVSSGQSRAVITGLGSDSGFMASGETVVLAGAFDQKASVNRVYAFTEDEVQRAIEQDRQLDASDGDLAYEGDLADATAIGNQLVVLDQGYDTETFAPIFHGLRRVPLTVDGDNVSVGESREIVAPGKGPDRPVALSASGWLLGLWVDHGPDKPATIALVGSK